VKIYDLNDKMGYINVHPKTGGSWFSLPHRTKIKTSKANIIKTKTGYDQKKWQK